MAINWTEHTPVFVRNMTMNKSLLVEKSPLASDGQSIK